MKPPLPPAHRALHIAIFGHSHSSMIAAIAFNYYLCSTESEKNYDRLSCVRFVCVEKRFVIVFCAGWSLKQNFKPQTAISSSAMPQATTMEVFCVFFWSRICYSGTT